MRYQCTKFVTLNMEVFTLFQTLDEWSFDVFALSDAASSQPVKYLGYDLLNRYGMIHKFKVTSLLRNMLLMRKIFSCILLQAFLTYFTVNLKFIYFFFFGFLQSFADLCLP